MKILIIHTAFIGDIVLSTPLIQRLKDMYPNSKIDYLTLPTNQSVINNNPNLHEILLYDKKGKDKGIKGLLYNERQAKRHEVKPGITGYAQVNGRNAISWEQKFELDTWYVENRSFCLDIKILFKTVWKVVAKDDINAVNDATMPKFEGNKKI